MDYPGWIAKNRWHSIDAHVHDGAGSMSLSHFAMKAANTLNIYSKDQIAFKLPDIQDQDLMTLCWHALSECGRKRIVFF